MICVPKPFRHILQSLSIRLFQSRAFFIKVPHVTTLPLKERYGERPYHDFPLSSLARFLSEALTIL